MPRQPANGAAGDAAREIRSSGRAHPLSRTAPALDKQYTWPICTACHAVRCMRRVMPGPGGMQPTCDLRPVAAYEPVSSEAVRP